jgi:N-acetylmuramoyl-L-alanine amidase
MLDPGHGGIDGGCNLNGLLEKDIVLEIALNLRRRLVAQGARVALTRESDIELSPEGDEGSFRHRRDLSGRVRLAREAKAEVMLSIHVNSAPGGRQSGPITFFQSERHESIRLANCIQAELLKLYPGCQERCYPADYYILRRGTCVTVLAETGYISHPEDRAKLTTPAFRQEIAAALERGLIAYYTALP